MGSDTRPLSALDSAGAGFLTPMISFLEEPLGRLRGDPGSVASGAGEFAAAGRDATSVADEYRSSAAAETGGWSGQSATDYLKAGTELADGILSIAETSLTSAKALIAAGEVVAKTVAAVTALITEVVARIAPIITEAIAAAPATFGQSLAVAIPQCVQIAADYGGRIAAKLAELLTSGENLIKLVEGALGVLKVVKEVLSFIGEQARGSGTAPGPGKPADEPAGSA
ncbi:WXG100 family type VII secretion target [Saccharothrix sp. HUAS TT1]|uniref:WXG100 family type VII secretion target n=1 Tax=unclassified Saccharothrix TaxID=2593673 RepID=UPI00345C5650